MLAVLGENNSRTPIGSCNCTGQSHRKQIARSQVVHLEQLTAHRHQPPADCPAATRVRQQPACLGEGAAAAAAAATAAAAAAAASAATASTAAAAAAAAIATGKAPARHQPALRLEFRLDFEDRVLPEILALASVSAFCALLSLWLPESRGRPLTAAQLQTIADNCTTIRRRGQPSFVDDDPSTDEESESRLSDS